tara:strand:- start:824 stop:1201 length:378 start_codon:yes stop_codon:yes gene_type:complete
MNIIIKNLSVFIMLSTFSVSLIADNVSRPKANNKTGLSKKTQEEKENSFFNRLLRGEYDGVSIGQDSDLDQIKSDIADLKKQNEYTDSNDKIIKQIKMLSNLRDEGILTESEFNDKKKILLDKLK